MPEPRTLNPEPSSRRVLYSGRVQGVGFRYTARRIAQRYPVTGYVKNLSDGRVELFAEGPPADLDKLLAEIAATMSDNIKEAQIHVGSATGNYSSFEVAY